MYTCQNRNWGFEACGVWSTYRVCSFSRAPLLQSLLRRMKQELLWSSLSLVQPNIHKMIRLEHICLFGGWLIVQRDKWDKSGSYGTNVNGVPSSEWDFHDCWENRTDRKMMMMLSVTAITRSAHFQLLSFEKTLKNSDSHGQKKKHGERLNMTCHRQTDTKYKLSDGVGSTSFRCRSINWASSPVKLLNRFHVWVQHYSLGVIVRRLN